MPKYVIYSDSEISAKPITKPEWEWPDRPVDPGWGIEEGGFPGQGLPGRPERPGHPIYPTLPPRDEWPSLPPWFEPGVGLPIPPTPEHPMVPIPPGEEVDPPGIWPPVRPEFPDLSGKSLALAMIYVSRHVRKLAWVVIDHEEAKAKFQALKDKLPRPGQGLPPGIPEREPKR